MGLDMGNLLNQSKMWAPAGPSHRSSVERSGDPLAANLAKLGLRPGATRHDIDTAYERLVSDLTPGPSADHRSVPLALEFRREVESAYRSLIDSRPGFLGHRPAV